MPSAVSPNPRAGADQPDELDNLLDYDAAVEDFLNDIPIRSNEQNANATEQQPQDEDQEVQVKKKRQPIPKLDENRLLSEAGIPKLRKITKSRVKFRGKGHEFSDISRLLNTYQLWLDDLYPRAKFRDALAMVEKVGHSKRMQVMRRAWLDDTKPNRRLSPEPDFEMSGANGGLEESNGTGGGAAEQEDSIFGDAIAEQSASNTAPHGGSHHDAPEDDELDALLAETGPGPAPPAAAPSRSRNGPFMDDEPDEDELDALLAESRTTQTAEAIAAKTTNRPKGGPFEESLDEDELDVFMGEQDEFGAASIAGPTTSKRMDDFADDEEAMATMGGW